MFCVLMIIFIIFYIIFIAFFYQTLTIVFIHILNIDKVFKIFTVTLLVRTIWCYSNIIKFFISHIHQKMVTTKFMVFNFLSRLGTCYQSCMSISRRRFSNLLTSIILCNSHKEKLIFYIFTSIGSMQEGIKKNNVALTWKRKILCGLIFGSLGAKKKKKNSRKLASLQKDQLSF